MAATSGRRAFSASVWWGAVTNMSKIKNAGEAGNVASGSH